MYCRIFNVGTCNTIPPRARAKSMILNMKWHCMYRELLAGMVTLHVTYIYIKQDYRSFISRENTVMKHLCCLRIKNRDVLYISLVYSGRNINNRSKYLSRFWSLPPMERHDFGLACITWGSRGLCHVGSRGKPRLLVNSARK